MGIAIRAVLPLMAIAIAGCTTAPAPRENNAALVIASCPEMGDVEIVTPADSWRLHVADGKLYNTCRCAALRNTPAACKDSAPPTP